MVDVEVVHPMVRSMRSEFVAARQVFAGVGAFSPAHRERVVAELRAALPDAVSRVAREVGPEVVVHELAALGRSAAGVVGLHGWVAVLWDRILSDAREAAAAALCC